MKESVGYDSNPNVYRLDVVLDIRDSLFNVLKRCIIRELLASVVDLALDGGKTIIDLLELSFEVLDILAHCGEAGLNVSEGVGVRTVVSSHALEVAREDALLARDLVQSSARVILEPLKLAAHLGKRASHLLGEDLGLLEMRTPLFSTFADFAQLELVRDSFDLKLPLLLRNV